MDIGQLLFDSFYQNIPAITGQVLAYGMLFWFYLRRFSAKQRIISSIIYLVIGLFTFTFVATFLSDLTFGYLIDASNPNAAIIKALFNAGFYLVLFPFCVFGLTKAIRVPMLVSYLYYSAIFLAYLVTPLLIDTWYLRSVILAAFLAVILFVFNKDIIFLRDNKITRGVWLSLHLSLGVTWILILVIVQGYVTLGWETYEGFSLDHAWLAVVAFGALLTEFILLKTNLVSFRIRVARDLAAITDILTGLPNYEGFLLKAKEAVTSGFAKGSEVAFVYFNVLHFRAYNEQYGREEGDAFLLHFRDEIIALGGYEPFLLCRHSSDRFILLTKNNRVTERIALLEERIKTYQKEIPLPLKAGIYVTHADAMLESEGAIAAAVDHALGTVASLRTEPRKVFAFYDETLKKDNEFKNYILTHFDDAIKNGYIRVFYQPIIELSDKKLLFLEALVRWDDPEKGLLFPGSFIPVLEQNHLTAELDNCVFERVCMDIRLALDEGRKLCPIGINLAPQDFERRNFSAHLLELLARYSISKDFIYLELDQDVLLEGDINGEERAKALSDEGFNVTLTGLGGRESSPFILADRKFGWIKIAGVYMRNFKNPKSKKILKNLINLGAEVGSKTIVEGVERQEQLDFILKNGASGAQGFYYCHPAPLHEVERVLSGMDIPIYETIEQKP